MSFTSENFITTHNAAIPVNFPRTQIISQVWNEYFDILNSEFWMRHKCTCINSLPCNIWVLVPCTDGKISVFFRSKKCTFGPRNVLLLLEIDNFHEILNLLFIQYILRQDDLNLFSIQCRSHPAQKYKSSTHRINLSESSSNYAYNALHRFELHLSYWGFTTWFFKQKELRWIWCCCNEFGPETLCRLSFWL